jgi:Ca2+-binding EF-hand superfamily protein
MTTAEKQKAFDTIDVNGNGTIEFKEWYKHFKPLIRKKNATMTAEKLMDLFKQYQGDDKGINFEEYSQFMDDVS